MTKTKMIKIKYVHSPIGRKERQKETIKCMGFTRLNQVRELPDNASVRGMVRKIPHLVQIVSGVGTEHCSVRTKESVRDL